MRKEYND